MNKTGTQTIETHRLILRQFRLEDAEDMFAAWASDPDVTRFLTWPAHTSEDITRMVLTDWISRYGDGSFFNWAIEWKDNRMLRDLVVTDDTQDTRTHKVFRALDKVCAEFDLPHPQWLDATIRDFKRHSRCHFTQDCFVGEEISFDALELRVLEED